ncbi:hypothetical protein, partial [Litorivivens sp.]|uniref:hypothetical protein n=1 Tax=Litorivivens sp. TaxID=2020868 RepID=UPI0035625C7B
HIAFGENHNPSKPRPLTVRLDRASSPHNGAYVQSYAGLQIAGRSGPEGGKVPGQNGPEHKRDIMRISGFAQTGGATISDWSRSVKIPSFWTHCQYA